MAGAAPSPAFGIGKIDDVIIGASPFVITMMLMIVILSVWPQIALWLPRIAAD